MQPSEFGGEFYELPQDGSAEDSTEPSDADGEIPWWLFVDEVESTGALSKIADHGLPSDAPPTHAPCAGDLDDSPHIKVIDFAEDPEGAEEADLFKAEVDEFVDETTKAFLAAGIRIGAHAIGLGPVYEVYCWTKKSIDTAKAITSDEGAYLSLPIPVANLDFMVRLRAASEQNGQHPEISMFVAPGDGYWAGAIELSPVEANNDERGISDETGGRHSIGVSIAEVTRQSTVIRSDNEPRQEFRPTVFESVVASPKAIVAKMNLKFLAGSSPIDRIAALQGFSAHILSQQFAVFETQDVEMFVGYDASMAIAFWVCPAANNSSTWRVVAEYDVATSSLSMGRPETLTEPEYPKRKVRAILRSHGQHLGETPGA